MRIVPLFLLALTALSPAVALAEVPERTFWAETFAGETLLDVTALSEGERASVEQMADKYPDEGKGAPRIPADEPLLLPRFRVGERYAVITAKGTYGLGIVGFAATRGASEAHLLVYLDKLPKGAGKEGLAVPEAWLPQDFRPKLTPLKAVALPKPIGAKLLAQALAGLSAEEKALLGKRKPTTGDLKAYTARMPSDIRWIVTCAKKLSLTEVFSGMIYVSASGVTHDGGSWAAESECRGLRFDQAIGLERSLQGKFAGVGTSCDRVFEKSGMIALGIEKLRGVCSFLDRAEDVVATSRKQQDSALGSSHRRAKQMQDRGFYLADPPILLDLVATRSGLTGQGPEFLRRGMDGGDDQSHGSGKAEETIHGEGGCGCEGNISTCGVQSKSSSSGNIGLDRC